MASHSLHESVYGTKRAGVAALLTDLVRLAKRRYKNTSGGLPSNTWPTVS
jgi:hypothetical protein